MASQIPAEANNVIVRAHVARIFGEHQVPLDGGGGPVGDEVEFAVDLQAIRQV